MTDDVDAETTSAGRIPDEVLDRLRSLTDGSVDDLTRGLHARVALSHISGPALLVDLDGTVLEANDEVADIGLSR